MRSRVMQWRDATSATPATRDRFVDFVRAMSILAVVLGHWLIAAVVDRGGRIHGDNALASIGSLRPVTWIVQIIAVFFVVGGYSNMRKLTGRGSTSDFFASRAERLLRPTVVFVVVWLVVARVLERTSLDPRVAHDVARIAAQPLWFLAVYAGIVALAPGQLALHRRHPWLLLVVLPVLAVALDWLRITEIADGPAIANYFVVFVVAQELGFHFAEGRFDRVRPAVMYAWSAGAFVVLAALTVVGPYPVSMVGLPGDRISNMSPPTVCILVLTVAQGALLLALRPGLTRWLARPGPWSATVAVNLVIMTLFLWHLSALVVVAAAAVGLDWLPAPGTAAWWVAKPCWIVACSIVLAVFVAVFHPVERLRSWRSAAPRGPWRGGVGLVLAARGLAGLALTGFGSAAENGRSLLGTRWPPLVDAGLLVVGWLVACGVPDPLRRRGQARGLPRGSVDEVPEAITPPWALVARRATARRTRGTR